MLFGFVLVAVLVLWPFVDCSAACGDEFRQLFTPVAVLSLFLVPLAALLVMLSARIATRASRSQGRKKSLLGSVARGLWGGALVLMLAALVFWAYATVGVLDGLSGAQPLVSSVISAWFMAVYSAVVGGGSWKVATRMRAAPQPE